MVVQAFIRYSFLSALFTLVVVGLFTIVLVRLFLTRSFILLLSVFHARLSALFLRLVALRPPELSLSVNSFIPIDTIPNGDPERKSRD